MSRGRKLLIVGLVLVVGLGLAWPFRHKTADRVIDGRDLESVAKTQALNFGRVGSEVARQSSKQPPLIGSPAPHVVAKMTSALAYPYSPTTSFDLANHPALASPLQPRASSPVTTMVPPKNLPSPSGYLPAQMQRSRSHSRPAYTTRDYDPRFEEGEVHEVEVRHVVQNSDTLEKLAKRYLGDEGRALELFDLNRDVLDNPHLLPIGAELKIPADAQKTFD